MHKIYEILESFECIQLYNRQILKKEKSQNPKQKLCDKTHQSSHLKYETLSAKITITVTLYNSLASVIIGFLNL